MITIGLCILMVIGGVIVAYVVIRLLTKAAFLSYFETKKKFNSKKEGEGEGT